MYRVCLGVKCDRHAQRVAIDVNDVTKCAALMTGKVEADTAVAHPKIANMQPIEERRKIWVCNLQFAGMR